MARMLSIYSQQEAKSLNYTRGYARALSITGSSYWYEGVYEIAQNYYLAASRQYQTIGDSIGLGKMYNNIGEVYKKLEQFDKSLEYQLLSLELIKKDTAAYRLTLYNISEIYTGLNQLDKAYEYLNHAFDLAKIANDKRVIAYCYWNYSVIKSKQGKLSEAISFLMLSENIWQDLGEKRSLVRTYQDLAENFRKSKNYINAKDYIKKADVLASQIHAKDLTVRNYFYHYRLDSTMGNWQNALAHMSAYTILKDSLYTSSKTEQINRIQTIYETEQREQENSSLRIEKELRDAKIKFQEIIIISIAIGFILTIILLALVFRQRQKILVVNKQLNEKTEEVQSQSEALARLNDKLQNLNKNLEGLVEERTIQVMAQNQKLSEYTFINAHKLRAPVASILGLINLLPAASAAEREVIFTHLKTCSENLDTIIREVGKNLEGAIYKE